MTISDFVQTKNITLEELEELFTKERTFTKPFGKGDKACINCGNEFNYRWLQAPSWTSVQYCHVCNSINHVIRPDCMGGNCDDFVTIFKEK
jgi:hypothetical protein